MFQSTPVFLARSGFACFADLPGHGRSHGLCAFVPKLEAAVDLIAFFRSVQASAIVLLIDIKAVGRGACFVSGDFLQV
jgi:hypothetical protein